jgi:hypothetical protein
MDLRQQVLQILAAARADVQRQMQAKGVNASGRTSASMQVRASKTGSQLVGGNSKQHTFTVAGITFNAYDTAPIPTLQTGSAPWASKPPRTPFWFAAHIYQWTIDKALPAASDKERMSLSFAIARKLINDGSERHRVPVDIYTTAAQKAAGSIRQAVLEATKSEIKAALAVTKTM